MRNNIIIGALALTLGLVLGFFLFRGNSSSTASHEHEGMAIPTAQSGEEIWTCSMHPQIRQNESGLCPICAMDLITLDATNSGSDDPLVLSMTEESIKLANIQTSIVGNQNGGPIDKKLKLSGKIQADERRASALSAHVPGRIEKLYISFTGEQVRKGQKLADIYSPELITAQRELQEAKKLAAVSPALVEAARNKLKYWKIGEETIKAIEEGSQIREIFTLYAEASGIVNQRRVSLGDYVKQGQPLFDMMNLSKVWGLFDAYEEDLANISLGDQIEFTTPSLPGQTFQARITFIDPVINPATRVAALRTEINNVRNHLKPEMLLSGMLQSRRMKGKKTQLSVPRSAVLWTGQRSVVYVKLPEETVPSFQYREIELGESMGANYQVIKGLEAGEEVVTYGSFAIDAAAQLNNQASMMNKNVILKKGGAVDQLPDYIATTPQEFKVQLEKVAEAYVSLKDALVATNSVEASNAAKPILENLSTVDMSLLEGDAHLYWMDQLNAIQGHTQKIINLEDVEAQRKQFDFLSQAIIQSVKVFGTASDTYYIQHCPMAFNNQGADWMSKEENILNPYFGDKMLTCGFVKESLE